MKFLVIFFMIFNLIFAYNESDENCHTPKFTRIKPEKFKKLSKEKINELNLLKKIIIEKELSIQLKLKFLRSQLNEAVKDNNEIKYTEIKKEILNLRKQKKFLKNLNYNKINEILQNKN